MASNSDSDTPPQSDSYKTCVWCNCYGALIPTKPYCKACQQQMVRECRRCKKPYNSLRFFVKDDARCNSCQTKYLKERQKRLEKQQQKQSDTADNSPEATGSTSYKTTKNQASRKRKIQLEYLKGVEDGDGEVDAEEDVDVNDSADECTTLDAETTIRTALQTISTWKEKKMKRKYAVILL